MSFSEHAGDAEHAQEHEQNDEIGVDAYDATLAARRAAERFRATCGAADAFFKDAGARYAPGSLRRDPSLGVLILDWSENHFNGIGDEMQHYQEMLAIGLGTGRAAYLQTQPRGVPGHGLGGSPAPPSVAHVVEACRFDLEDFFTGIRGVDWRWDGEKERKVADELGVAIDETRADELVVTWSPKGMYYRTGRDGSSVAEGEAESPDGTYVAPRRQLHRGDDERPRRARGEGRADTHQAELRALVPPAPTRRLGHVRVVSLDRRRARSG